MAICRRRRAALVLAVLVGALVVACGNDAASPSPEPTTRPTVAPIATPSSMAAGPLEGLGPLGRATYETPAGFEPAFSFEVRGDGWRTITEPDEFGFVVATPNAARADALIGLLKPVAATVEAFTDELTTNGLLDASATQEDVTIGGMPARSFGVDRSTPSNAFTMRTATGEVLTSFGGDLAENLIVFVAHPDGPFALILSLGPDGGVEARFVFDSILDSIAFR